jgi:glycosyltransferase involved in cell wall biosynthesis
MIKIGIYDRYLNTLGGGERYSCKMAEILSKRINGSVDLITDIYANLEDVSDRLNLDLSKVNLKIFPFISEDYASKITGNYDIFINATYLSSLSANARYNIYLCYFPTPFNSDFRLIHKFLLLFFRLPALWLFKIADKMIKSSSYIEVKEGLYDLKRFMLKRGSWSSGKIVLKIKNFSLKNISFGKLNLGFKNPSSSGLDEMNVTISVFSENKVNADAKHADAKHNLNYEIYGSEALNKDNLFFEKKFKIKSEEKINFEIPLTIESNNIILITSDTFVPSELNGNFMDSRTLGVVLYDNSKTSYLKKIILKIMGFIPLFLVTYPLKLKFLDSYQEIISISHYSQYWIKKLWGKESTILFPPVDTENFYSKKKEKIILSAGRFFPEHHNKKQLELAQVFIELYRQYPEEMKGYELILAGGLENKKTHLEYVDKIKTISEGFPIKIMTNISWTDLLEIFAKAEIFWHAAGTGEDENKHPEKFEHFGITTVEAMAAGCIPIVINKGGQKEIIKEAENGFMFETFNELKEKTLMVIGNREKLNKIKENAIKDSALFSNEVFEKNLLEIINKAINFLN